MHSPVDGTENLGLSVYWVSFAPHDAQNAAKGLTGDPHAPQTLALRPVTGVGGATASTSSARTVACSTRTGVVGSGACAAGPSAERTA